MRGQIWEDGECGHAEPCCAHCMLCENCCTCPSAAEIEKLRAAEEAARPAREAAYAARKAAEDAADKAWSEGIAEITVGMHHSHGLRTEQTEIGAEILRVEWPKTSSYPKAHWVREIFLTVGGIVYKSLLVSQMHCGTSSDWYYIPAELQDSLNAEKKRKLADARSFSEQVVPEVLADPIDCKNFPFRGYDLREDRKMSRVFIPITVLPPPHSRTGKHTHAAGMVFQHCRFEDHDTDIRAIVLTEGNGENGHIINSYELYHAGDIRRLRARLDKITGAEAVRRKAERDQKMAREVRLKIELARKTKKQLLIEAEDLLVSGKVRKSWSKGKLVDKISEIRTNGLSVTPLANDGGSSGPPARVINPNPPSALPLPGEEINSYSAAEILLVAAEKEGTCVQCALNAAKKQNPSSVCAHHAVLQVVTNYRKFVDDPDYYRLQTLMILETRPEITGIRLTALGATNWRPQDLIILIPEDPNRAAEVKSEKYSTVMSIKDLLEVFPSLPGYVESEGFDWIFQQHGDSEDETANESPRFENMKFNGRNNRIFGADGQEYDLIGVWKAPLPLTYLTWTREGYKVDEGNYLCGSDQTCHTCRGPYVSSCPPELWDPDAINADTWSRDLREENRSMMAEIDASPCLTCKWRGPFGWGYCGPAIHPTGVLTSICVHPIEGGRPRWADTENGCTNFRSALWYLFEGILVSNNVKDELSDR